MWRYRGRGRLRLYKVGCVANMQLKINIKCYCDRKADHLSRIRAVSLVNSPPCKHKKSPESSHYQDFTLRAEDET
jgi:hypothetical protein